jgi:hypothetical protein
MEMSSPLRPSSARRSRGLGSRKDEFKEGLASKLAASDYSRDDDYDQMEAADELYH